MKCNPMLIFGVALVGTLNVLHASYPEEILSEDPVAYWRLGESGTVPADLAVNAGTLGAAVNGVYQNRPQHELPGALATGDSNAIGFNGVNQYVRVPHSFDLNPFGPFTLEFWVQPAVALTGTDLTSPLASLRRVVPAGEGWVFYQTPTGWNYRQGDSINNYTIDITGTTQIEPGEWYHLVVTFDGELVTLYVNGQAEASMSDARYMPNPEQPLGIGARGDGAFPFNGSVDQVAIYGRVLTGAEVEAHYQTGLDPEPDTTYPEVVSSKSPIAYWRLDEPAPEYPVAVNSGSLGEAADGTYLGNTQLNVPGPRAPDYQGFEADNGAAQLDQSTISMPELNLNSNQVTITAWIRMDAVQPDWAGIVFSRGGSTTAGLNIGPGGTELRYHWNDAGSSYGFSSGVELTYGEWNFVGLVVEPDRALLFAANSFGFQIVENAVPHAIEEFNAPLRLGLDSGSRFFSGMIDEVAVFDKSLTEARLRTLYASAIGNEPPGILVQPAAPAGNLYAGQSVTLRVEASGSPPMTYEWRRADVGIVGGNSPILELEEVGVDDSGSYTVTVTNANGSIVSETIVLTVNPLANPVITQDPQDSTRFVSGTARFEVLAEGSPPLSYQWFFGDDALEGETDSVLFVAGIGEADGGAYSVVVTNPAGDTPSAAATLTVVVPDENTYLSTILSDGPAALWRLNETGGETGFDLVGGFDGTYIGFPAFGQPGALMDDPDTAVGFISDLQQKMDVPFAPELNTGQFTIEVWAKVTGGQGVHRSPVTSRDDFPQRGYILYATPGDGWEFWTGTGAGWNAIGGAGVEYNEWTHLVGTYDGTTKRFYVNGVEVGSNQSAFSPNTAQPVRVGAGASENPLGSFFFYGDVDEVAFYPYALSADRVQAHYGVGLGATTPPSITSVSVSQAVLEGDSITFSVQATGSLPLTYQWQLDGVDIPDANEASLMLANVGAEAGGSYRVVVSNPVASVESDLIELSVLSLPDIGYREAILADGPISYWPLNELDGIVATDIVGARNGEYQNDVILGVPGIGLSEDTAARFTTASQSRVEIQPTFELNGYVFSVELWARATGGEGQFRSPLTSRGDFPQEGYIFYAASNNTWQFWTGTGQQVGWNSISGPPVVLNEWAHLVATYDGFTKRFYVNGRLVGSNDSEFGPNFLYPIRIGGGATETVEGSFYFEGDIDEVAYYDKVLTPEQILIHYGLGSLGTEAPEVAILVDGDEIVLIWTGGTLVESESIDGPWTEVEGATSPYSLSPTGAGKFFQVLP